MGPDCGCDGLLLRREVLRDELYKAHVDNAMVAMARSQESVGFQQCVLNMVCCGLYRAITPEAVQYLIERHRETFVGTVVKGAACDPLIKFYALRASSHTPVRCQRRFL